MGCTDDPKPGQQEPIRKWSSGLTPGLTNTDPLILTCPTFLISSKEGMAPFNSLLLTMLFTIVEKMSWNYLMRSNFTSSCLRSLGQRSEHMEGVLYRVLYRAWSWEAWDPTPTHTAPLGYSRATLCRGIYAERTKGASTLCLPTGAVCLSSKLSRFTRNQTQHNSRASNWEKERKKSFPLPALSSQGSLGNLKNSQKNSQDQRVRGLRHLS